MRRKRLPTLDKLRASARLMDFAFTEEQAMLRDLVQGYLADVYDDAARQAAVASEAGWRPEVWRAFAVELGILGATFGEEQGGLGGGAIETMILMEEFGRALVIEPYLATMVIAGGLLKHVDSPHAHGWIARIIAGEAIFAFAHTEPHARYNPTDVATTARRDANGWVLDGCKAVVIGAPWASHLVVTARTAGNRRDADGLSIFIAPIDAPGVTLRSYATIDGQRAADITLVGVELPEAALVGSEGVAAPLIERVIDEATAAICAEACGVMRRIYADTVAYTRERHQFGQPIADFQVPRHRMVDMFIHIEQAAALTQLATLALGADYAARAQAVSAAKARVGQACRFVGQNAVQLHGGIGVTNELPLGRYFKRATMLEHAFGPVDHHLTRFERLAYADAA